MYKGKHEAILAAYRGGQAEPLDLLSEKELAGLRFIRWLLETGRITK